MAIIDLTPDQSSQITKENFGTLVGWLRTNKVELERQILHCSDDMLHTVRARLSMITEIMDNIDNAPDVIRRINEFSENTGQPTL